MATYRINGHELTGSAEAISQLKDLMAQHANDKCELHDRIEKLERFATATEIAIKKLNNGELSEVRISK